MMWVPVALRCCMGVMEMLTSRSHYFKSLLRELRRLVLMDEERKPENKPDAVELRVSTWLGVIADMARSRIKTPELDPTEFEAQLMNQLQRMNPPIGEPEPREALLRIAALAMRMLDEHHPGDGLEF